MTKRKGRWKTQDGRELTPRQFEDSHLMNTIAFIERRAEVIALKYGTKKTKEQVIAALWPIYDSLVAELRRRIAAADDVTKMAHLERQRKFTLGEQDNGQNQY